MALRNEGLFDAFMKSFLRERCRRPRRRTTEERPLALVGVGNEMRGDDGAGIAVLRHIERLLVEDNGERLGLRAVDARGSIREKLLLVYAGQTPENHIDVLVSEKPSHILFFDAADLGLEPGTAAFLSREELNELSTSSISTHKLPLMLTVVLVEKNTGAKSGLVGIQPMDVGFGEGLSPVVAKAVEVVAWTVIASLFPPGTSAAP